jgi:membrane fusion protein, heavy metal efflux system
MKRYYYIIIAGVIVMSSCKGSKPPVEAQDYTTQGDTIRISAHSPLINKIKTTSTTQQDYSQVFTASGVVKAIPNKYAEVASPFAGRIIKSYVRLGQKVSVGSPIFEISSADFFESVKDFYQARQELNAAYIKLKRERDLVKNKVGAKKEEEDAELEYHLKKKEVENTQAALSVYHISPGQISLGKPLIIRSPIAGDVVKSDIVTGSYLKDDANSVVTIANLEKVWMVAHVKEKDIHLINNLSTVGISLISMPEKDIRGKIYYISQMMDEETHSVEVIIECNNTNHIMKPGMYGYVKLADRPVKKIMIPSSAILQEESSQYVFVKTGKDEYVRREVKASTVSNSMAVILSGLNPGEEIITQGAFYLNNIL